MFTTAIDYVNSTYSSNTSTESSTELGQDEFLQLFIAQLENQDPLNPMDDTETIAQLAEFSSLEQLSTINETLSSLSEQISTMNVNSAVSYLGMTVTAAGNGISKDDDDISSVTYTLPEDAQSVTAHIYSSDGDLVASVDLSVLSEGEHEFQWDGETYTGTEASDGQYYVAFEAYDADGDGISVTCEVEGTVTGIGTQNGTTVFTLDDGRTVSMMNVTSVNTPSAEEA